MSIWINQLLSKLHLEEVGVIKSEPDLKTVMVYNSNNTNNTWLPCPVMGNLWAIPRYVYKMVNNQYGPLDC